MRIKGILTFAVVLSATVYLAGCASSKAKSAGAAPPTPESEVAMTPSPEETLKQEEMERERARQAELERQKMAEEQKRLAEQAAKSFIDGLGKVYFDFDRYDVKPKYRGVLVKNAEIIKDHPSAKVVVEGHCDERGTAEYNLALGERRALSVKKYLFSLGVGESSLYTISYGEEKPADPRHNKEAWAKNRRVQFGKEE